MWQIFLVNGAGLEVRDAGCGVRGAGFEVWVAGCEVRGLVTNS